MSSVAEQPLHRALGLTDWEFDRICELLERPPNDFELAVFSLLWSEHCGYKHSALLLRRFPTEGEAVLQGPGENAGVVDVGEGRAIAFKVESHNHPSAVEPFQGAATGVGGILRDVVAMGARPIALLDSLRFGDLDDPGQAWMFGRAVAGVGHYGNCLAGDERVVIRNSGRARVVPIGELVDERGPGMAGVWSATPSRPFQVLSFDQNTRQAQWRDVSRVFRVESPSSLRIKAALGRSLTVSEDHPVMIVEGGELVARAASQLCIGDLLPIICELPKPEEPAEIDLIDLLDEPMTVMMPGDWRPSKEVRQALRSEMPRADSRHYYLSRNELPIGPFRSIETTIDVDRRRLRLRLPGPRSSPVPARLRVDRDFARLIGYYLSEGCCSRNGTTYEIIWTFGRTTRDARHVDDLRSILSKLDLRHSFEERRSTFAVTVSSRLLGRMLTEILCCGSKASEKEIPSVIFNAGAELRYEVLKGIFRGDGSLGFSPRGSRVRVSHTTTSVRLHEQVILLLQSIGIVPSRHERPARRSTIKGRSVESHRAYALEFYGHDQICRAADLFTPDDARRMRAAVAPTKRSRYSRPRSTRTEGLAAVPIVDVERRAEPVGMYDLEVPGTHLFVTSGAVVTHNCTGIPNVGGEAVFDERYAGNCLVNAMCVGELPAERVTRASMTGPGTLVVVYGATTGRDGIGGASVLASQELSEADDDRRPSVQVGDPFTGKKLIEASLELVEGGLVESLQDCGAAGLASSLAEMASRGGAGVDVRLDQVPLREQGMEPWEIMVSESQERMVCTTTDPDGVAAVCRKWELECAVIGEVTQTGRLRCFHDGEAIGDIPAQLLTDECPRYPVDLSPRELDEPIETGELCWDATELVQLVGDSDVASRAWIYGQYDQLVQSRTVRRPGLDAAVLRLRPSYRGIAVSLDGAGRLASLDPRAGGALAVLEAARNVACAGGRPLAVTDCLNFGNPEKPEIAWELAEAIEGMASACEALGIPVVSGNVSLYNETDGRAIHPTPVVGCVGLVEDVRAVPGRWRPGDAVLVAGAPELRLDGSAYQARFLGGPAGRPPAPDLAAEATLVRFLVTAAPLASCVHDAAEGGLAACLAECAIAAGLGAELDPPGDAVTLFGEGGGQAVVACEPATVERIESLAADAGVPLRRIGSVGGERLLGAAVTELASASESALPARLG